MITSNGVSADPQKIKAIVNMKAPSDVSELRCFLGMTNQLGKFSSNLAEMTKPLRELLTTINMAGYIKQDPSRLPRHRKVPLESIDFSMVVKRNGKFCATMWHL